MPGSRSSAAPSVLLGSSLQPIAVPVARHDRRRSGMVSSLATLLSMLENIAQRLSRLWARVANLNELPGNSPSLLQAFSSSLRRRTAFTITLQRRKLLRQLSVKVLFATAVASFWMLAPANAEIVTIGLPAIPNNGDCIPFSCPVIQTLTAFQQVYTDTAFSGVFVISGI